MLKKVKISYHPQHAIYVIKEPCSAAERDLIMLMCTSEAHRRFEEAVAADPQHATAWNNLGHFLRVPAICYYNS